MTSVLNLIAAVLATSSTAIYQEAAARSPAQPTTKQVHKRVGVFAELGFIVPNQIRITVKNQTKKTVKVLPIALEWYEPSMLVADGSERYLFQPTGADLARPDKKSLVALGPGKSISRIFTVDPDRSSRGRKFRVCVTGFLNWDRTLNKLTMDCSEWKKAPVNWVKVTKR